MVYGSCSASSAGESNPWRRLRLYPACILHQIQSAAATSVVCIEDDNAGKLDKPLYYIRCKRSACNKGLRYLDYQYKLSYSKSNLLPSGSEQHKVLLFGSI